MISFSRILIVDDSSMMRTVIRRSLKMAKVEAEEIVEAGNGLDALHALELNRFDVMFCDLNMPECSGDELIERLMSADALPIPPIIIISSEASTERIDRLNCQRIVGVLRKPFSPELIVELLLRTEQSLKQSVSI